MFAVRLFIELFEIEIERCGFSRLLDFSFYFFSVCLIINELSLILDKRPIDATTFSHKNPCCENKLCKPNVS